MIKKPLYLKFKDKAEADIVLANCNHPIEIHGVGILSNNDGVYAEDFTVITEPTVKDGWHVNLLVPLDCTDYDLYSVSVITPACIWAGY